MSKPKRIVTASDHVKSGSGFGGQHRILCEALASTGQYEVISLGLWDQGRVECNEGYLRIPIPTCDALAESWPRLLRELRPDVFLPLGDLQMFNKIAEHNAGKRDFRWVHWLPVDGAPYPVEWDSMIRGFDRLVLMSDFAAKLYEPRIGGCVRTATIGHGVNPDVFKPVPAEEKARLRKQWTQFLNFDLTQAKWVLVSHETNSYRKNTPALLEMMTYLPQDTVLVLHCTEAPRPGSGGWHLTRLAKSFGVANRVVVTGKGKTRPELPESEIADLIRLADVTVSATMGEGFGIGSIGSMACGVPRVITDYTTSREILFGPFSSGAGPLAKVQATVVQPESPFIRAVVDSRDMAEKVMHLRDDPQLYDPCSEIGKFRVRDHYTAEKIKDWIDLIARDLAGKP